MMRPEKCSIADGEASLTAGLLLAVGSIEEEVNQDQHKSRNAQQPRKYIFTHDRAPG